MVALNGMQAMDENGPGSSKWAVAWILVLAMGIVVAHAIGRPGGSLQEGEKAWKGPVEQFLKGRPEFAGLSLRAERFDVILSGRVPTAADREKAVRLVRAELPAGRERLRDEVGIWTPPWLTLEKARGGIRLRGELPEDGDFRRQLAGRGEKMAGDLPVDNRIWFHRSVFSPVWEPGVWTVVDAFVRGAEEGTLEAKGNEVILSGSMTRKGVQDEALAAAAGAWGKGPQATVRVINRTTVRPGQAAEIALRKQGQGWDLRGLLPDYGAGKELSRQLAERFRPAAPVRVAPNVEQEAWMGRGMEEAVGAFADALQGDGLLQVTPREVRLEGNVRNLAAAQSLTRLFAGPAWGKRTLVNGLTVPAPANAQPLWLELGHSAREFEIRGAVSTEAQKSALLRRLKDAGGRVTEGVLVGGDAVSTPAWWPSLVELVGMFAKEVRDGSIQVAGQMIQLSGTLKAENGQADFQRRATALKGLPEIDLRLTVPGEGAAGEALARQVPGSSS